MVGRSQYLARNQTKVHGNVFAGSRDYVSHQKPNVSGRDYFGSRNDQYSIEVSSDMEFAASQLGCLFGKPIRIEIVGGTL